MMATKKKQASPSKSSKHPSSMHPLAPPIPPRPLLAALRLPRKSPPKEPKSASKYLRTPANGFYISNSCDNVHKLSRESYLNEVYGNSHILLGQHVHKHKQESGGKNSVVYVRSSPWMKLCGKAPFAGSEPDMGSYGYLRRSPWGPEKCVDYAERRVLMKEKRMLEQCVDGKVIVRDKGWNYACVNGYDCYDARPRCYDSSYGSNYNSSYSSSYGSGYSSYHHKNTLPAPSYPVRKVHSTNSSSSSKSSSKSKSSAYSHEQSVTYAKYTFNHSTFRADALLPDKERVRPSLPRSPGRNPGECERGSKRATKFDYSPISNFSKQFPLSAKMTSLHGLPPLPKSLSGVNLQSVPPPEVNGIERNGTVQHPSGAEPRECRDEERKGRTLPTPPASLSQNNVTPVNYVTSSSRKPVSLDAKLTVLRQEMYGLRQLDLSLLSQLWSLNESIQEFRQLQESVSVPSPSDDGEDTDEMIYSNLPPVSGRRYRKISRNADESSSSSSSVDFGKV